MKTNKILGASIVALSVMVATPAMAQAPASGGAGGAGAAGSASGGRGDHYWKDASGAIWKDASGKCWRDANWTAADANAECDPELMPKPAPPKAAPVAPRAAPPPPPPPKPAPAKPKPEAAKPKPPAPPRCDVKVTLDADDVFLFGKATLQRKAFAQLDDIAAKAKACGKLEKIIIEGHTDRLGSNMSNLKLSQQRADAVKAYLVTKKGLSKDVVDTMGMGKTMPVHSCPDDKNRKALIKCLAPNRRAEVQIKGLK